MKLFYNLFICTMLSFGLNAQVMDWVFLGDGVNTGACPSATNCGTDQLCYGLEYTPSMTGTMTSYTTGFFINCVNGSNPIVSNESCLMTNNSGALVDCGGSGSILFNSSGNSGTTAVVKDVQIIIHQICFDLPASNDITMAADISTGLTVSIDSISGGGAEVDLPTHLVETATSDDCSGDCDGASCSRSFGSGTGDFSFDLTTGTAIVDGTSMMNAGLNSQSFDIYDEAVKDCGNAGGQNDVTFNFTLINTTDVNGNGIIDALGGAGHNLNQGADGLDGSIPLGASVESESSSGDYRGYEIEVDFADHLAILANQLTIDLKGINSAGRSFESAVVIYKNHSDVEYGTATYDGFYNGTNDLSGNCGTTVIGTPWSITGPGIFHANSKTTVDLTDPCNPVIGAHGSANDTLVLATVAAGLMAGDTIGGFVLRVILEDIAAPEDLDDGSGIAPDDGIIANDNTNSIVTAQSRLAGFNIFGCVFNLSLPLPAELLTFEARPKNKEVQLDWLAIVEKLEKFEIQWSTDGNHFTTIGYHDPIPSSSSESVAYQFMHKNPVKGINYYRLKPIDLDGTFDYSAIRSAEIKSRNSDELIIYPNPTFDQVFFDFPIDYENDAFQLRLMDVHGKMIMDQEMDKGNENFSIDLSELPSAIYLVNIKTAKAIYTMKLIKK